MTHGDLTGRLLGEFVLGERIGEGGHGTVYRARQPALGRDVVVKVLRAQRRHSPVAQERFLREAQLASLLDHPYAAHVYAFGVDEPDGLMWIAMELVRGVTLQDWLVAHGPMSLEQLVPFIEHVAQVVHAAHQQGIVHRDLKPSNMMVLEHGGSLYPKLLDFGIAKAPSDMLVPLPVASRTVTKDNANVTTAPGCDDVHHSTVTSSYAGDADEIGPLTLPGAGIGSPAYMSPEQWRDAWAVGPATDIYALGVVVYRALAGVEPFVSRETGDYYRQHLEAVPPTLAGALTPVDLVIQRALAKEPSVRYATAIEMAAELRAALRSSEREQLRAAAQQWDDRRRSPGLLWGREEIAQLDRWERSPPGLLSALERRFVTASQHRVRRHTWLRRGLLAAAVVGAALLYLAVVEGRIAAREAAFQAQLAATTVTQAELERGRAALLHGEPDAALHLQRAYRRDPKPGTAFMLARALQPRLAQRAVLHGSAGRMWKAAFSRDGEKVLTADDKNAQIWSTTRGELLATLPHGCTVYSASYGANDTTILTAGDDGQVRIWDATTARLLRTLRPPGRESHYAEAIGSPDGAVVAAIDVQGAIADLWDATNGQWIAALANDASEFPAIASSSDSRWLASTGGDNVVLYDLEHRRRARILTGPRIVALAFDPTGPRLLTGSVTGDVSLWSLPDGARHHLREVGERVDAVAFSRDGQLIAAASSDGMIAAWRTSTGEIVHRMSSVCMKIRSLEFDGVAARLVAGCADGTMVIDDIASNLPVAIHIGAHVIQTAHFSPDGTQVVTASFDGAARLWRAGPQYGTWRTQPIADDCATIRTPDADRRFVAFDCKNRTTLVWDTARHSLVAELPSITRVVGDFASAFAVVSSDGARAAIARGRALDVFELPSGRRLVSIPHTADVNAVAFAEFGHDLVSGAVDGSLRVVREGEVPLDLPKMVAGIDAVALLVDHRVLAADAGQRLRVYDARHEVVGELALPGRAGFLRADGDHVVTVPIDPLYERGPGPPALVDLASLRLVARLDTHVGRVFSARWIRGGRLLTAGGDGTARLWDGRTGAELRVFGGPGRYLADAAQLTDDVVVTGGADGMLRYWDLESGQALWSWHAHRAPIGFLHIEHGAVVTRAFDGEMAAWDLPDPGEILRRCAAQNGCDTLE